MEVNVLQQKLKLYAEHGGHCIINQEECKAILYMLDKYQTSEKILKRLDSIENHINNEKQNHILSTVELTSDEENKFANSGIEPGPQELKDDIKLECQDTLESMVRHWAKDHRISIVNLSKQMELSEPTLYDAFKGKMTPRTYDKIVAVIPEASKFPKPRKKYKKKKEVKLGNKLPKGTFKEGTIGAVVYNYLVAKNIGMTEFATKLELSYWTLKSAMEGECVTPATYDKLVIFIEEIRKFPRPVSKKKGRKPSVEPKKKLFSAYSTHTPVPAVRHDMSEKDLKSTICNKLLGCNGLVGITLLRVRTELNQTHDNIGKLFGVPGSWIKEFERGDTLPEQVAKSLSNIFNISLKTIKENSLEFRKSQKPTIHRR